MNSGNPVNSLKKNERFQIVIQILKSVVLIPISIKTTLRCV